MRLEPRADLREVRLPGLRVGLAGSRELQEVLRRAREEAGQVESDDVRARTVGEIELHRQTAALLGVVGNGRVTAPVREARRHAHRLVLHVGGRRESGAGWSEGPGEQGPLRVRRPMARVPAGNVVDRVDDLFSQSVHGQTLTRGGRRPQPRLNTEPTTYGRNVLSFRVGPQRASARARITAS